MERSRRFILTLLALTIYVFIGGHWAGAQGLTVVCTNNDMIVTLVYKPIVKIDLDKVTLKDEGCTLSKYGSVNATHLTMKAPLDSCKTNYTANDDSITYQNSLIVKSLNEGGEEISRENTTEFIFICSYPSSAFVSVVSFSPREKIIYSKTVEYGNFTFTMDMYETDQYAKLYDNYPVNLDLNGSYVSGGESPTQTLATLMHSLKRELTVLCTNNDMIVTLVYEPIIKIDLDKVTLKDEDCTLSKYGSVNRTHLTMNAPLDSCKTNYTAKDDSITYQNTLIVKSLDEGREEISREYTTEFIFKCSYPSSAFVSVVNVSPGEKIIYTKTVEYGNFTYTMDMYQTDQYATPYDNYPVNLDLNDPMYLEVKVMSNDSKLVIIPLKCWGTSEPNPDASHSYAFIENGCNKDDTLVYNYKQNAVQRFKVDAFRFLGKRLDAVVYLHCNVEFCRKDDSDSRCAKGCLKDARKRRDVLSNSLQQRVTDGPVRRSEPEVQTSKHLAAADRRARDRGSGLAG